MQHWRLRALWAYPLFVVLTIIASLSVILVANVFPKLTPSVWHAVKYRWSKCVLRLLNVQVVEPMDSKSRELASGVSHVVVAPHRSILDPLVIAVMLPNHRNDWVVKEENFKIPFIGQALRAAGCLGTKRSGDKHAAMSLFEGAAESIRSRNASLVVFASGSRHESIFKKGAFHFAKEEHLPIMPISIEGAYEIIPPGSWWKGVGGVVTAKVHQIYWCDALSVEEARSHAQDLVG